jgi:hypothetical protein
LIDKKHIEETFPGLLLEQAKGSSVAIVRRNNGIARLKKLRQQCQGGHPR